MWQEWIGPLFVAGFVALIIALSYVMTSDHKSIRMWGCRTVAVFFAVLGVAALLEMAMGLVVARGAFMMALVLFGLAGWQWKISTK